MLRPARKQVDSILTNNFSYKQGDQEYNIWYNKFLSNDDKYLEENKFRESAFTRCDPELDTGYTKADLYEKFQSVFCRHWSKGCCYLGQECRFYHRVPDIDFCRQVEQSKDIFGRERFAEHRKDKEGVGTFLSESRTLEISMIAVLSENQQVLQEIIFRHFSIWGEIEEITVIPYKSKALIRFAHRCMAEFAKESMINQALDNNEVIAIKWTDDVEKEEEKEVNDKKMAQEHMRRKIEQQRESQIKQIMIKKREQLLQQQIDKYESQKNIENYKKQKVLDNVDKMQALLQNIEEKENQQSEENEDPL